ncbi:MAG TPA: LysM peptidoglycan-binding domain-containing protein [Syntrophomonas sp.]|nr:LysM peptidoglycan-binding domain-containing protein [Syntrophomonas sp.]
MYSFYLGDVLLPVAPAKLTLQVNNRNKTVELMNLGEVTVLKQPGLSEFNFECLLPGAEYPFAVYEEGFKKPALFLEEIEVLKTNAKPFEFRVTRFSPSGEFLFNNKMDVSLEEYSIVEDAEQGFDVTVSVKLKQYKEYATRKLSVISSTSDSLTATMESTRPAKEPAKTYTVKAGDSLWAICQRQLGDGSKYVEIAALNGIANARLIYPGQVLKLG